MKLLRFTLLFCLLATLTLAQSVRLYPVGTDRVIADGATGTVLFVKPSTAVSLSAKRSDVVQLEVNGVLFGTYLPANFLKQDGTAYSSASVAASVQAYKDAVSAASSGGGGSATTDASQLISGQLPSARIGSDIARAVDVTAVNLRIALMQIFNVQDGFGAVGDGVHDDTPNFQAAINAAIAAKGKLLVPTPSNFYKITSTLLFEPTTGNETVVNVEMHGTPRNTIRYSGTAGTPCIKTNGLRFSKWEGVNVYLANSNDLIGVDIDTYNSSSSSSFNTFINSTITQGTGTGQQGWRVGHIGANGGDFSSLEWNTCLVYGDASKPTGTYGWHIEGSNALQNNITTGFTAYLDKGYSNVSGSGATGSGNGAFYFTNFGTSQNNTDIEIGNSQTYVFNGGRFESGKRVLTVNNSNVSPSITFIGTEINDYGPSDGILYYLDMPCSLMLINPNIKAGTHSAYGSNMIKEGGGGSGTRIGRVSISGGSVQASSPFRSDYANGTTWVHYIQGVAQINSSGVAIGMFPDENGGATPATLGANTFTGIQTINSDIKANNFYSTSGASEFKMDAPGVSGGKFWVKTDNTVVFGAGPLLAGGATILSFDAPGTSGGGLYLGTARNLGVGNASPTEKLDVGGNGKFSGLIIAKHYKGNTSAPSIAAGVGGGTPTGLSVTGNDSMHKISFTTGAAPTTGTVVTVTFNQAYTTNAPAVMVDGTSTGSRVNYALWTVGTVTTTGYTLVNTGTSTLPANTLYTFTAKVEEQ